MSVELIEMAPVALLLAGGAVTCSLARFSERRIVTAMVVALTLGGLPAIQVFDRGAAMATLGDAIKNLRGSGRIQAPLLRGIEEIWGWASGTPGVRHGSAPALTVDASTARYIVAQSEAAIALLLSTDAV